MKYLLALISLFPAFSYANECEYIAKLKESTVKQYKADMKLVDVMYPYMALEAQGTASNITEDAFKAHMMDLEHFATVLGCSTKAQ